MSPSVEPAEGPTRSGERLVGFLSNLQETLAGCG